MEKRFEKIDESILNKIKDNQNKAAEISFEVGQLHFRLREVEKEVNIVKNEISLKEQNFDALNIEITNILQELNVKYPDGELDFKEGGVYF